MRLVYSAEVAAARRTLKPLVALESSVLAQGLRTADIWSEGTSKVSTVEMGDAVVAALEADAPAWSGAVSALGEQVAKLRRVAEAAVELGLGMPAAKGDPELLSFRIRQLLRQQLHLLRL